MRIKPALTCVMLALCFAIAPLSPRAQEMKAEAPKVLAVLFYADWCKSCKVLEPKLDEVKRGFQGKSVLFTRFDMTDEFTKEQSGHYAALLGLEAPFRESQGKTGYLLLVEARSKRVLGKITKEKTAEEIKSMLSHALLGHPVGGGS